jgi:thiol-disulfide isomerase/thioredoxin
VYTGLDGSAVSLADERFAGKPKLLVAFGTWCPNCNDEAALLRELDQRYRDRGLAIVGLGFELSGERQRDLEQLRRFQARHGIEYPLLLAGVADKERASESLPLLERVRAYPTTIFVGADGTVQAVHQGFAGPATGAEHAALCRDFERRIEALLAGG